MWDLSEAQLAGTADGSDPQGDGGRNLDRSALHSRTGEGGGERRAAGAEEPVERSGAGCAARCVRRIEQQGDRRAVEYFRGVGEVGAAAAFSEVGRAHAQSTGAGGAGGIRIGLGAAELRKPGRQEVKNAGLV